MKRTPLSILLALLMATIPAIPAIPAIAQSPDAAATSTGALLYQTHCIACHDQKVHWRERKLVTDWASLAVQVRRWQDNTGLRWSDSMIEAVVRYLNTTIYRFPEQAPKQTG